MLDHLHARLRDVDFFQRATLFTRTLLALGFISPGVTKVLGLDFAPGIDTGTLVGAYFDVFHQTGPYYAFVGLAQTAAGALLLWRPTALLGALAYLPIIVNIFVLTVALPFGMGTPVVTGLMTLACLWLVGWDAHRLMGLVKPSVQAIPVRTREPALWDLFTPQESLRTARWMLRTAYVAGFVGLLVGSLFARNMLPLTLAKPTLMLVMTAVLLVPTGWAVEWMGRRQRLYKAAS
ncbi:MAG: hypothetical protein AAGI71_11255 [Bacteroidota bacterium]